MEKTRATRALFAARLGQSLNVPDRHFEARFGATAMDGSRWFQSASIADVLRGHLEARDGSAPRNNPDVIAAALSRQGPNATPGSPEASGHSIFTDALGNVSTLIFTQVYGEVSDLARRMAAQVDVADFKTHTTYRLE